MEETCSPNDPHTPENEFDGEHSLILEQLAKQLTFLNDKFKVYENINGEDIKDCINPINNKDKNNNYIIDSLNSKLKEKDEMLIRLKEELNEADKIYNQKLKEKDLVIEDLRKELELIKKDRNDNKNNLHIRGETVINKMGIFNLRQSAIQNPVGNSHQNSLTSISSLYTPYDHKQIEKLNNQKLFFEKELVEYKLKYAENMAKLNDLEGQFDKLNCKYKTLVEKLKSNDNLIKRISEERDHYKFNTNSHYSTNSCEFKPPNTNSKKIEFVHCDKKSNNNLQIVDDYISQTEANFDNLSVYSNISNISNNSNFSSKTERKTTKNNSIFKMIKNIF